MQSWPSPLPRTDLGLTLVELMVGTAVGALLIMATVSLLTAVPHTNERLGSLTRLQERSSRVQFLLDTEIQEAQSVTPVSNGLRLVLPGSDGTIDYLWDPEKQTLKRNGPGIDCRGALRLGGAGKDCDDITIPDDSDSSVVSTGIIAFSSLVNNQSISYSLSFRDPLDFSAPIYERKSTVRVGIRQL